MSKNEEPFEDKLDSMVDEYGSVEEALIALKTQVVLLEDREGRLIGEHWEKEFSLIKDELVRINSTIIEKDTSIILHQRDHRDNSNIFHFAILCITIVNLILLVLNSIG